MNQHQGLIPQGIGERLSRARLARGWSVDEAAGRLKLTAKIIEELESEQGEVGEAAVYRRGYCLNYARLLGIDDADFRKAVTRRYKPAPAPLIPAMPRPAAPRVEHYLRMFTYAVGSFVIVIPLVWSLTQGAASFFPLAETTSDSAGAASEPAIDAGGGQHNPAQTAQATPEPPPYLSASAAPLATPLPERDAPPPAAPPAPSREVQAESTAGASLAALILAIGGADSWVEIHDATERRVEYDLLRAATRHEYQGVPPFRLLIGQAAGVQLYYRGEPVDLAPYTRGNVASFTLGAEETSGAEDAG